MAEKVFIIKDLISGQYVVETSLLDNTEWTDKVEEAGYFKKDEAQYLIKNGAFREGTKRMLQIIGIYLVG